MNPAEFDIPNSFTDITTYPSLTSEFSVTNIRRDNATQWWNS